MKKNNKGIFGVWNKIKTALMADISGYDRTNCDEQKVFSAKWNGQATIRRGHPSSIIGIVTSCVCFL